MTAELAEGDPRVGRPDSGETTIVSGDGNTPQTAYSIDSTDLFVPTQVKIEYDDTATATADVEMYDEADGTSNANASDRRDRFTNLQPGEVRTVDDVGYRDFEDDVLFATSGNQDGEIRVTVYGVVPTALADVAGV